MYISKLYDNLEYKNIFIFPLLNIYNNKMCYVSTEFDINVHDIINVIPYNYIMDELSSLLLLIHIDRSSSRYSDIFKQYINPNILQYSNIKFSGYFNNDKTKKIYRTLCTDIVSIIEYEDQMQNVAILLDVLEKNLILNCLDIHM